MTLDMVSFLLRLEVDPNVRDHQGRTPLHLIIEGPFNDTGSSNQCKYLGLFIKEGEEGIEMFQVNMIGRQVKRRIHKRGIRLFLVIKDALPLILSLKDLSTIQDPQINVSIWVCP